MNEPLRRALETYLRQAPDTLPPGGGAFRSGYRDTADRIGESLDHLRFASGPPPIPTVESKG